MSATDLLLRAKETGIRVWREGKTLRYRGPNEAIAELLPEFKEHKAEVLEDLRPLVPSNKPSGTPTTPAEEGRILAWLDHIGETDEAVIASVLGQCRRDGEARAYFLERSEEVPHYDDDRRHCRTCRNFRGDRDPESGYCTAYGAHVVDHPPRRCIKWSTSRLKSSIG